MSNGFVYVITNSKGGYLTGFMNIRNYPRNSRRQPSTIKNPWTMSLRKAKLFRKIAYANNTAKRIIPLVTETETISVISFTLVQEAVSTVGNGTLIVK